MTKKAILLINVGTPDEPKVKAVRRYLRQFLNDLRVIDLPWLLQKILVNFIIVPFRAPKSTQVYKQLWTDKGSPLLYYSESFKEKLQQKLGANYNVFNAMRYGNPSINSALEVVKSKGYERVTVLPMFPQYASSTTGTAFEYVMKKVRKWNVIPEIRFVNEFFRNEAFISAFVNRIKQYNPEEYDYVVFSYHGLPNRHVNKTHPEVLCNDCTCDEQFPKHGKYCYRASCYETTRLLASACNIPAEKHIVAFQSRLSKDWLTPFTDKTIARLASEGKKKVLIVAPAFVADCLETTVELGIEYKEDFTNAGGEKLQLVDSLNDMDEWVEAVEGIVIGA